ncbi:MAG: adenylate/guanylate cyclase domain-containing response regulator [Polaromonas sp.]|nr:adenylate/guanylate cyclase domain-containing response regulator [Polaromonas sp.]
MKNSKLMLIDSDGYTRSLLMEGLAVRGYVNVKLVNSALELPSALESAQPDVVIFNYHSDKPDSLSACTTVKLMRPQAAIVAIVSPGPALKAVRTWSLQTRGIDVVIEKPLSDERFFITLQDLLQVKVSMRELQSKSQQLSNLVPEGALSAIESSDNAESELFEAVVLFTDMRGSSQLIRKMPPRSFFNLLNQSLSAQSIQIRQHQGSVIKYTGDGLMAIFRGTGKSYLALQCALDLAITSNTQELSFGVGVAKGMVLAGLIGDFKHAGQRRQYDVIGATAHLAARLCEMADPGEVIATGNINAVAKVTNPTPRAFGKVSIRGFNHGTECVAFKPSNESMGVHE